MENLTKEQEDLVLDEKHELERIKQEELDEGEQLYPHCRKCDKFVELEEFNYDMQMCDSCVNKDDAIFEMIKDEMVEKEIEDNKENTH